MKLNHIDENSSMHPDDIYNSVLKTIASMRANHKPGDPDPNANYGPTGDAASQEEHRFRQAYHRDQDEREKLRSHGRLEEEPDALAGRRKDDPAPHPYRKHGTPLNKPPANPDYPTTPFNKDDWMASSKKMEEEEQLDELTNDLLRRYKTAAAADAGNAEKTAWDPASSHKDSAKALGRSNKRFSGIIKATKKQFDNDKKARAEEGMMGGINRSAPATDVSYEKVLDDGVDAEVQAAYKSAEAPAVDKPIGFILIDPKEGNRVLGKYRADGRSRANARRDKLDNAYGAYRYKVKPVYPGEEHLLSENKHRNRVAAVKAGQPGNFTDILNRQHQDKQAQEPAKVVSIPFHGWEIKYKPDGKGQVNWVVIKGEKILQKGVANSDKEAVGAAEEWIKQGAGEKKSINKNATIDFNKQFVMTFAPDAQPFYATFVTQNGQPYLVMSSEPHEGLTKSSIRAGGNFPSIHVTPRVAQPVGLQPHGRYIVDVDKKEDLEDPGVAMYPLVFQGIIQDKSEREHMKGPGFTVAYSRDKDLEEDCWKGYKQVGMKDKGGKQVPNCVPTDEALDPWHGYTKDDKKANAQARAPSYAKHGSVEVPFSELVCDTIRTHGIRWAFQFYVVKHGLPPRMFKIFAKDALENRE